VLQKINNENNNQKMAPIIEVTEKVLRGLDLVGASYKIVQSVKPTASIIEPPKGENYILLDREHQKGNYSQIDLLVPFEKTHLSQTWNSCETPRLLAQENGYMLQTRAYVDFLKSIKSGKAFDGNGMKISPKKLESLYEEITAVRSPWRGELLDAKFGNGTITYYSIQNDGSVKPVTEELGDCLMKDKTPGIRLDSWLRTANNLGLPTQKTRNGNLYFWHPQKGAVARFVAGSVGAGFVCGGGPAFRDGSLGVRVARKK
jgi:hypothetical protein